MNNAKIFLKDIWRLAKPYWISEERLAGLGLLAVIVSMSLGIVFINIRSTAGTTPFTTPCKTAIWRAFTTS